MKIDECTPGRVHTPGGGEIPPCAGLASGVLPKAQSSVPAESSQTGVSTRNALSATSRKKAKDIPHWYAIRATYGREKKAYDYLNANNVETFYPTIITVKMVGGKRKCIEESRLPNILFVRGTEDKIKQFVYDNVNLPYLRFYYRHFHKGMRIMKEPLIVPDNQMENLKIICASEANDIIIVPPDVQKFKTGQKVRVVDGGFKGVTGRVARFHGQQRVAVVIEDLLTITTAYIPRAFLQEID